MKRQVSAIIVGLLLALCLPCLTFAQKRMAKLTIFPNGLGLVEEERTIAVKPGVNEITFGVVSKKIILDSVQVKAEGCKFLEQECSSDFLLSWKVLAEKEEEVQLRILYLTTGLNWDISYQLDINEEAISMDIYGWAGVENTIELNFSEVELTLTTQLPLSASKSQVSSDALSKPSLPSSSSLLDISYPLPYPVNLRAGGVKRFLLFSQKNIPLKKVYLFDYSKYGEEVREELWFVNIVEEGLGIPLPEGPAYLYQASSKKGVIFLGEIHLPEISLQEIGKIYLGPAKNLKGERRLLYMKPTESYEDDYGHKVVLNEYSREIILHNYRELPTTVTVVEHFYGQLEELESDPSPYLPKGGLIVYEIEVPPYGERNIQYKARIKSVDSGSNTTGE